MAALEERHIMGAFGDRDVCVVVERRVAMNAGADRLTPAEQRALATEGFGPSRAREWIAGRMAAHRALVGWLGDEAAGLSVLNDADGAPRVEGRDDLAISLSHDDGAVAVALAVGGQRSAAVDLCGLARAARVGDILERLGLPPSGLHPCVSWAALECALKLRRRSVWSLLGARPRVRALDGAVAVSMTHAQATVNFALTATHAVAWGTQ